MSPTNDAPHVLRRSLASFLLKASLWVAGKPPPYERGGYAASDKARPSLDSQCDRKAGGPSDAPRFYAVFVGRDVGVFTDW